MDFEEAGRRYAELKRQFDAGSIDADYFNAQRQRLMVQDDEGRWWAKSPDSDEWNYYDGSAWVPGTPQGKTDDFEEAERRYDELKRQFDAGSIDADYFDAQQNGLMVQGDEVRCWAMSLAIKEWNYYDGNVWVRSKH